MTLAVGDCVDRRSQWRTTQWCGTRKEMCVREEISDQSASTQAEDRPMNYRARLEGADALARARLEGADALAHARLVKKTQGAHSV